MKGKLKSSTVDKYLRSVRKQIVDMVEPGSSVVEYGCGNGDLLIQLASKIKHGHGLDYSKSLIGYAIDYKDFHEIENLEFDRVDLVDNPSPGNNADYGIASLLLHVLPQDVSLKVLNQMLRQFDTVIICAFTPPLNWKQKALLWMDQRFSGHYNHFKTYSHQNFMEGLLAKAGTTEYEIFDTFDPVIKIYRIQS